MSKDTTIEQLVERKTIALKKRAENKVFKVYQQNGVFVREYSVKVHGKDAKKMAEGFAQKKNFIIK